MRGNTLHIATVTPEPETGSHVTQLHYRQEKCHTVFFTLFHFSEVIIHSKVLVNKQFREYQIFIEEYPFSFKKETTYQRQHQILPLQPVTS